MHDVFIPWLCSYFFPLKLIFYFCSDQIKDKLLQWNSAYPVHSQALGFFSAQIAALLLVIFPIKCCYPCINKKLTGRYYISENILLFCYCHTLLISLNVALMCKKLSISCSILSWDMAMKKLGLLLYWQQCNKFIPIVCSQSLCNFPKTQVRLSLLTILDVVNVYLQTNDL